VGTSEELDEQQEMLLRGPCKSLANRYPFRASLLPVTPSATGESMG
jgi:hypothetical protein